MNTYSFLKGSFSEIASKYATTSLMIDSLGNSPAKLAELLIKSVEAQDFDAADKICNKIKSLDNSSLNVEQIIDVIVVSDRILYKKGDVPVENSRAVQSLMDKLILQKLSIGQTLSLLKSSVAIISKAPLESEDKAIHSHLLTLCENVLAQHNVEIEVKDDFTLTMEVKDGANINQLCENSAFKNTPLELRLQLCNAIVAKGTEACVAFCTGMDQSFLSDASSKDVMDLCYAIISNGEGYAATYLTLNIDKFNLENTSIADRLKLCHAIAESDGAAALPGSIEKFKLSRATPEERLKLVQAIAKQPNAIQMLAEHFHEFNLGAGTSKEQLELCQTLVKNKRNTYSLIKNIEKFDLSATSNEQRLDLYKDMIRGKRERAIQFLQKFEELNLSSEHKAELFRVIMAHGWVDVALCNIEKFNFSQEKRQEIFLSTLQRGEAGIYYLIGNIDQFLHEFPIDERLKLYHAAIKDEKNVQLLATNFYKLLLADAPVEQRLEFYKALLVKEEDGFNSNENRFLVEKFDVSDTSLEQRMDLCHAIVSSGQSGASALAKIIDKYNLHEMSNEQWHALCKTFIDGNKTAKALAKNIEKFNIYNASLEQRQELAKTLANRDDRAAAALAGSFEKFNIQAAPFQEELAKAIVASGPEAARALVWNLKKFKFQEFPLKLRLELSKAIVASGPYAADSFVENIELFNIREIPLEERLNLSKAIIASQDGAARLAKNIEKFDLQEASTEDWVELSSAIASSGPYAAEALAENIEKFNIQKASIPQRLDISKLIFSSGAKAAKALGDNLSHLQLQELTKEQRMTLLDLPELQLIDGYPFLQKFYSPYPAEQQELTAKLLQKLTAADTPPEEKNLLGSLIFYNLGTYLNIEDPLMQAAIEIITVSEGEGLTNPFHLYAKLQALSEQPSPFQPPKATIEGSDVSINLEELKSLGMKIDRQDLPKNVTREAFTKFYTTFKNKLVDEEGKDLAEGIKALKEIDEEDLSFTKIDFPLTGDPSHFLLNLLNRNIGPVSDEEAKWKAVLSNIFDKSKEPKENAYFSEQQEVFITTMMHIQKCTGGKLNGINLAYDGLEKQYQYPITLPEVDPLTIEKKELALKALSELFANPPVGLEGLSGAALLAAYASENYEQQTKVNKWTNTLLEGHPDLETLFFEEEFYNATPLGLEALATSSYQEKVAEFMGPAIVKLISQQFDSGTALMEALTGSANPNQGAHVSIYLKNLVGPIIGAAKTVTFDLSTGVLDDELLEKSREEVLEILFKHLTPKHMMGHLIREVKSASPKEMEAIHGLLASDDYWFDASTLSTKGALELLRRYNFFAG